MAEFRLNPQQVEETFQKCLAGDTDDENIVDVDMIVAIARLDRRLVADHAELILAMLLELPTEFRASGGGGWSFLNACMDRHGDQWTGLHQTMAMLFALGQATDPPLVTCQLPRDVWPALPGGMPYYVINDKTAVVHG